jgi:hypothetical protein
MSNSGKKISILTRVVGKTFFERNKKPNFCKGNSMFIVNGRVGNDKNIGRFTCRNASVALEIAITFLSIKKSLQISKG